MLTIDLDSVPGASMLAALAERHGNGLARTAKLPSRLFVLRSPHAPGLRFVGGEVDPARALKVPSYSGGPLSLAGSGEALEDAFAACLGEGVERLSQVERHGDVRECPYEEAEGDILPAARSAIETLLQGSSRSHRTPVAWVRGQAAGRQVLVPADWCLRRQARGPLAMPGVALSTGCAAGSSFEAAASRALLELVERDAVALWWIGGHRARPLAGESAAMSEAVGLLGRLRQGVSGRASWLLDLTADLGIPCIAAISVDQDDGRGLACGFGARLSLAAAARAAVLEMCQMELALLVVSAKRQERGDGALNEVDRHHLERAARIAPDRCALIHPLGSPGRHAAADGSSPSEELEALLAQLMRRNIEAALIDLTRPDLGIPVASAVAPQLQLLPCGLRTERLRRAIEVTGGGERWTEGVALL